MKNKEAVNLSWRYFALVFFGFIQQPFFYFVFTPLTVYPVLWILSLIYGNTTLLEGSVIYFGSSIFAQIIDACVAGAAYYLLLVLNLTTPMENIKRVKSILFLFVTFLALNVIRIVVFALLAARGGNYFNAAHMVMWYFGSTIMLVLLWFLAVWIFKIGEIPVYTDAKRLFDDATGR